MCAALVVLLAAQYYLFGGRIALDDFTAGPPAAHGGLGAVEIDISACRGMYVVLKAMRDGGSKEKISSMLDSLLDTRPYQVMFRHYNRSWRPNELPKVVFKRMILSLQFPEEYSKGENKRADTMRMTWLAYYPDLTPYERQLYQLEATDLNKSINDGVRYAQRWLPAEWKIPDFYMPVIPNGGSPAFSIDGSQGYDFLQLSQGKPLGEIDLNRLVGTVAHESHHLGLKIEAPRGLNPAQQMAFQVVTMCIPEGAANEFISGPPAGRVPKLRSIRFHIYTPDLVAAWNAHVVEEEDMVRRQSSLLDEALRGQLTQGDFDRELREYWFNGAIGRGYVLGSEMLGAIYLAFGKRAVLDVMRDPRRLFQLYNMALAAKPRTLGRCPRFPEGVAKKALSIRGPVTRLGFATQTRWFDPLGVFSITGGP